MNNPVTPIILVFYVQIDKSLSTETIKTMCINLREQLDRVHNGKNIESFIFVTYKESRVECINPVLIDKKKRYAQYSKIKNILKEAQDVAYNAVIAQQSMQVNTTNQCMNCATAITECEKCNNFDKFTKFMKFENSDESQESTFACMNCKSHNNDNSDNCITCEQNSNFEQKPEKQK